ncbi:MAG: glycosyltransferase family 2 protein [Gemmatimonadaceae bacterium]
MTEQSPAVSVLMTAYNREALIARAIDSVLASTFKDFELIVVDDASRDRTAEVARSHAAGDSRVKVFVNERNLGDYPNRNRAATHATGKYLKYVDSDDFIYPHGLEVMAGCMEAFPAAGLGLSAVPDATTPYPCVLSSADAYRAHFFQRDLLGRAPGSTIMKRSAFEEVGGFSGARQVGDHELWMKMARRFPIVKMPADLVWDGDHPDQQKNLDSAVDWTVMHEEVEVMALRADDCPLTPFERNAALARIERRRMRSYWHFLRHGGGLSAAEEYRHKAAVPLRTMLTASLRLAFRN